MKITGDSNTVFNNNVGDSGKGNTGDGIYIKGNGNGVGKDEEQRQHAQRRSQAGVTDQRVESRERSK